MKPDNELLRQYAQARSEEAFAELVKRHVDLVYSAALRQVGGDAHLAHDVAQNVFTDLARKAGSLSRRESLTGWLYTSAHFAASKLVRTEHRRREREEEFMREPTHDTPTEADWEKLRPILDAVMHDLKETDREAVLLRYFENRPYTEVGAKLGINENTARMRVERALEKLRALLAKRGLAMGAGLAAVISANAVQTAPGSLAATLSGASLATAGIGAITFFKMMTATNLKLGLGTLAVAIAVSAFVIQRHAQAALRAENESLAQQVAQLKTDNANLSNQVSAAGDSQLSMKEQEAELLKLRAEVTRLRSIKNPSATTLAETNDAPEPAKTIINLKTRFVSAPAGQMPASAAAWAPAGSGARLLSKEQFDSIIKALKEDRILQLIGESQITTRSGDGAGASVTSAFPIDGTNAYVGTTLNVTPYYSPDSSIFTLNLMAQLNQLTGEPSQPVLQTIQTPTNRVTLFPGQTVVLQQDIPAGGWLPDASNAPDGPRTLLVFVTPATVEATEYTRAAQHVVSQEEALQKMGDARQGMLALIQFSTDNQNQFPTDFGQVSKYLKVELLARINAEFEILYSGPASNVTHPATTIVLKEKQAWLSSAGKWMKTYGFADGHSEIHSEPNGNFDEWEQQHLAVLKNQ